MNEENSKETFVHPYPTPLLDAFEKNRRQERREREERGEELPSRKSQYTPKEKREAISKWLGCFSEMNRVDTRRIGKLIGPFYVGIIFVTNNLLGAGFRPELYASNMCEPKIKFGSPKIGFGVAYTQPAKPVTYDWPEEVLEEYMNHIKKQFFIHTEGPATLDDIFNFFMKLKDDHKGFLLSYNAEVPVLIAIWAGEQKKAQQYYDWLEAWLKSSDCKTTMYVHRGNMTSEEDTDFQLAQLRELMKQPEKLRYNFIESVKVLGLEKAAYQNIEGTSYKEPYFSK